MEDKDEAIKFDTANLAEEKGYPFKYVTMEGLDVPMNIPTQARLQKWLREVHELEVISEHMEDTPKYKVKVYHIRKEGKVTLKFRVNFDSYEEALEKGLFVALKLIKL